MAWARLDDHFADHPKIAMAGPLAAWLHTKALVYCGRYLTNGKIHRSVAHTLVAWAEHGVLIDTSEYTADTPTNEGLARRLVEVGLWEETDEGYVIHDYLDWNPSAEQVKAERARVSELRREAGRIGGARSRETKETKQTPSKRQANGVANGVANREANGVAKQQHPGLRTEQSPVPVPVPVPIPEEPPPPNPPSGVVRVAGAAGAAAESVDQTKPAKPPAPLVAALTTPEIAEAGIDPEALARLAESWALPRGITGDRLVNIARSASESLAAVCLSAGSSIPPTRRASWLHATLRRRLAEPVATSPPNSRGAPEVNSDAAILAHERDRERQLVADRARERRPAGPVTSAAAVGAALAKLRRGAA